MSLRVPLHSDPVAIPLAARAVPQLRRTAPASEQRSGRCARFGTRRRALPAARRPPQPQPVRAAGAVSGAPRLPQPTAPRAPAGAAAAAAAHPRGARGVGAGERRGDAARAARARRQREFGARGVLEREPAAQERVRRVAPVLAALAEHRGASERSRFRRPDRNLRRRRSRAHLSPGATHDARRSSGRRRRSSGSARLRVCLRLRRRRRASQRDAGRVRGGRAAAAAVAGRRRAFGGRGGGGVRTAREAAVLVRAADRPGDRERARPPAHAERHLRVHLEALHVLRSGRQGLAGVLCSITVHLRAHYRVFARIREVLLYSVQFQHKQGVQHNVRVCNLCSKYPIIVAACLVSSK